VKETGIKIAVPNKGRLREPALNLLKKAGFSFRAKDRALYAHCTNADITLIFLRADDIPVLVEKGVVHLGITGEDLVEERNAKLDKLLELGFGRCRLCVAARADKPPVSLKEFEGKTIATSFPVITANYFKSNGVNTQCIEMKGSVKSWLNLGWLKQ
jgi:ATP phosphoribosyltransferase